MSSGWIPGAVPLGAHRLDDGRWRFHVWAPKAQRVEVLVDGHAVPMQAEAYGYHTAIVDDVPEGALYQYRLDGGRLLPDPASRAQPQGVHGASQVLHLKPRRSERAWYNLPLKGYVFYEIHVGTFTPEGTFEAVIPHLDELAALGITALELMPVAQFPGERNWGYDGVFPFAVQGSYGGAAGLRRLVDACHARGMAVVLDVVYNHLGPEGNYFGEFAPYFTDRYRSPWGVSLNFDGEYSDGVRRFFIENAIYWLDVFEIDALRLDATHALLDFSAVPFLDALSAAVHEWAADHNRRVYLIAENDRSDVKVVRAQEAGGAGLDAQWLDDLHHALHVHLTGETNGYYEDYAEPFNLLIKCLRDGFIYSGGYSPFRKRRHGTSSRGVPGDRFVVFTQNHDHVGNRMLGERLGALTDLDGLKLAAGVVILSPYLPLLFMGEEYGETAPFLYFTSHSDPQLVEAVREGRKTEFAAFAWQGDVPDPQDAMTFERSRLKRAAPQRALYDTYKTLLHLRKTTPALRDPDKGGLQVEGREPFILMERRSGSSAAFVIFNLHLEQGLPLTLRFPSGDLCRAFASHTEVDAPAQPEARVEYTLHLPAKSFVVYTNEARTPDDASHQHD